MMKKLIFGISLLALASDFYGVYADAPENPVPIEVPEENDLNQIQNLLEALRRYAEANMNGNEKDGIMFAMRRITQMYKDMHDSKDADDAIKESCGRIVEQLELLTEAISSDTPDEFVLTETVANLLEEVIKQTASLRSQLPQEGELSKKDEMLSNFVDFFGLLKTALESQWIDNEENIEKFADRCIDMIVKLLRNIDSDKALEYFKTSIPNSLGFKVDGQDVDGEYKKIIELGQLILKRNPTPKDIALAKAKLVELLRSQSEVDESETDTQSFLKNNDYQTATEAAAAA